MSKAYLAFLLMASVDFLFTLSPAPAGKAAAQ
jgi:hypothetical protein